MASATILLVWDPKRSERENHPHGVLVSAKCGCRLAIDNVGSSDTSITCVILEVTGSTLEKIHLFVVCLFMYLLPQ